MSDSPRNRWLQVHLSTAVVLMFAAGCLIWANVTAKIVELSYNAEVSGPPEGEFVFTEYGWPATAYRTRSVKYSYSDISFFSRDFIWDGFSRTGLAVDALVALLLIWMAWYVCERRIELSDWRRERDERT